MKLTSNYHYHTISAEREEILDMIQEELEKRDFWPSCRIMSLWISGERTRLGQGVFTDEKEDAAIHEAF